MIGSRSTNMLRDGLRSASVAAFLCFVSLVRAQSTANARDTGGNDHPPSITACVTCHGVLGAGTARGGPRLAGKDADYLVHALVQFRAGTRESGVMQAVARNLSHSEIRRLATFCFLPT
jgi:cytochrome c553